MASPVVLITGAGRGVGRAIALQFAADGYAVALTGRSTGPLHETSAALTHAGTAAFAAVCDVTSRSEVARTVSLTRAHLGEIDVLVNNAGVADSAPFASMDDEMWDRILAVNLTGTYNVMRAVVPAMLERRNGRVINIASRAAKIGYPYTSAYVASKHGVLGLTRAVALEARGRGVTVNAICPGWIDSDMTAETVARIVTRTGRSADEARRSIEQMNRRGRLIPPEEIAHVAAYLASPGAAGVNGQDIDIE